MADSATLSRTNLYSQSFWNLFNLLNTRSNVVDPVDGSGKRKFVYGHDPMVNKRAFEGYPFVVVNPASINRPGTQTAGNKKAQIDFEIVVEVHSTDNYFRRDTVTDPHGKGLTFLDNISDDIMETLNSESNRDTLRSYATGFFNVEGRNVEPLFNENNEMIFIREFIVTFNAPLLTVSA